MSSNPEENFDLPLANKSEQGSSQILAQVSNKLEQLENEVVIYRDAYKKQEKTLLAWQDSCAISNTKLQNAEAKIAELVVEIDELKSVIGALSIGSPQQNIHGLRQSDVL